MLLRLPLTLRLHIKFSCCPRDLSSILARLIWGFQWWDLLAKISLGKKACWSTVSLLINHQPTQIMIVIITIVSIFFINDKSKNSQLCPNMGSKVSIGRFTFFNPIAYLMKLLDESLTHETKSRFSCFLDLFIFKVTQWKKI